jgi:hypothetical protein
LELSNAKLSQEEIEGFLFHAVVERLVEVSLHRINAIGSHSLNAPLASSSVVRSVKNQNLSKSIKQTNQKLNEFKLECASARILSRKDISIVSPHFQSEKNEEKRHQK